MNVSVSTRKKTIFIGEIVWLHGQNYNHNYTNTNCHGFLKYHKEFTNNCLEIVFVLLFNVIICNGCLVKPKCVSHKIPAVSFFLSCIYKFYSRMCVNDVPLSPRSTGH